MLHTEFQASQESGFEEEDFGMFFYVVLWFKPSAPELGPFWTFRPPFEQTWTSRQCYIPNFQHFSLRPSFVGLELLLVSGFSYRRTLQLS